MATGFRPAVLAAREKLAEGREKLKAQHAAGSPGVQVCAGLTDMFDAAVLELWQAAANDAGAVADEVSLVAHGGYGRRDVAPYSDVDLMLLVPTNSQSRVAALARQFTQSIYDTGLQLGFSMRTPLEASMLAFRDAEIFTSLSECRWLCGDEGLFAKFIERFRRDANRRYSSLISAVEKARRAERQQYGEVVYLLRPNVKRSRGGLRDLQLLRWVGFARYGQVDLDRLQNMNALSPEDHRSLRKAREFLLRLRNELHFHAGKPQDVLEKSEQVRIADLFAYEGTEGVLPVEQFMRAYFAHTSEVRYTVSHFIAEACGDSGWIRLLNNVFSHHAERDFRVGPTTIGATRRGLTKVTSDLTEVLRLMDLANRYSARIDHNTWQAIRSAMSQRISTEVTPEVTSRFMSLLSQPGRLAELLRRLHELRALEQIVPAMKHARCLLQFNEYHKYTVDAHCIRAVECATEFFHRDDALGEAYRGLRNKGILHLALLIHDLGKGFTEDHSDVGLRIAAETAELFQLPERDREVLEYLVHKHLKMAHLALRHDLHDERMVVDFAAEVRSPDVLQMMFVLTAADLAAVGPGVLNDWKLDLITRMYQHTLEFLVGDTDQGTASKRNAELRRQLLELAPNSGERSWWERQITNLPRGYLFSRKPEQIVDELTRIHALPTNEAVAWGEFLPEQNVIEYTIGTHEEICPGVFHRLTGALSSKGLQILSAEIHTLADNLVLDRFFVEDLDYVGNPPPERTQEVCNTLVAALKAPSDARPKFRRVWKKVTEDGEEQLNPMPTRVGVDNDTSERYTIVTVFAYDRLGLLYTITRTLFELGLNVHLAKIGTHIDQVADVFYVTQADGQKLTGEEPRQMLKQRLLDAIAALSS